MYEVDLRSGEMSDLFSDYVKVGFPWGEEGVELIPVLGGEGPVHGGGHVDHFIGLIYFGTNKLRLQN
jgi:hypothetical protein